MKTLSKFLCASSISFVLVGCGNTEQSNKSTTIGSSSEPIQLIQHSIVGHVYFPDGDTEHGGKGAPIDGIKSQNEMLNYHIHAHLTLIVNGQQIAIPKGIGVLPPYKNNTGFVSGQAYYWLHTHDATGIIHIESPHQQSFTLGNFFDIWGEPLDSTNVAGFKGKIHAYVDGKTYSWDLKKIELTSHKQITLEVGIPTVVPPVYIFPPNLAV